MEFVAGLLAILILLWVCSGSDKTSPEYDMRKTKDDRYFEVVSNKTGEVMFIGTERKCQEWIDRHTSK